MAVYFDFIFTKSYSTDWAKINSHEDWFVHSKYGSTSQYRVKDKQYSAYLMNISNPGWQNYVATWCVNKTTTYPMIDGIFADDVAEKIFFGWNQLSVNTTDLPTGFVDNWNTNMIGLIKTVKSAIGKKLLIVNTPDLNGLFIQYCDGQAIEHFMHRSNRIPTDFNQTNPLSEINLLEKLSATGKIVVASSGASIPKNPSPTQIEQQHQCMLYTLSGFLLGYNPSGNAGYAFQDLHADYTGHNSYWDEMDAPIGVPTGKKYNVKGDLWSRNFTSGKVFLNVGDLNTYTVNVGGKNYVITPRSGLIVTTNV